jgi:hypothetical protein
MKNNWPKQSEMDAFYGNPRGPVHPDQANVGWEKTNLTNIIPPFYIYYEGRRVKYIRIHKKCAASLKRVLKAILLAAKGDDKKLHEWMIDQFSGSYVFRLKRNGNTLSCHAYGAAVDFAAATFPMGQTKKRFVPEVVQAFTDEGWTNLSTDPMHFQAAILG